MRVEDVSFASDGLRLAGRLRLPEAQPDDGGRGLPAVVLNGPLTSVKDQVTGRYAELLTRAGLVTLAFDPRCFGESEGEPRQHESPNARVADLRDAVSWLGARPEVDRERIGLLGICFGAGPALKAAASDPRVKALACVAPVFEGPPQMLAMIGAEAFRVWQRNLAAAAQAEHERGEAIYVPIVAADAGPPWLPSGGDGDGSRYGVDALMWDPLAHAYYASARNRSVLWENRATLGSHREVLAFDAVPSLELLHRTPLLLVHGTEDPSYHLELLENIYTRAREPKRLVRIASRDHMDFYDDPRCVAAAAGHVAELMLRPPLR